MHQPYVFDALSPEAVRRRLDTVDLEEKTKLAEALALIALMDERGDYLEAGYSCMQKYCMGRLGMSEEKAQRRIRAARLGRHFSQVFPRIADGRLTVTNACEIAPVLTPANAEQLFEAAAHKPKLEVRRLVYAIQNPAPTNAPTSTPSSEPEDAQAPALSLSDLCALAAPDTGMTETAPARVNRTRGRVFETEHGAHALRVEFTEEEFADFTKVRDLLSHVVRNGDPAEVIARALSIAVAQLEKQRYGAGPGSAEVKRTPKGRHIPKALRRFIAERDGYCCTFTSPDGHRCGETRALQIDHITPLAQGGETRADNLRLLCAHHNRHEAAKRLGEERMAARREQHDRALAEHRKAKEEALARALTRRESDADLHAALKSLGMTREQSEIAVERTAHLALGPIEDRVQAALKARGKALAA